MRARGRQGQQQRRRGQYPTDNEHAADRDRALPIPAKHPVQPHGREHAGGKGEEEGDHGWGAQHLDPGQEMVEDPVDRGVWTQGVGQGEDEEEPHEQGRGPPPRLRHQQQGQEEDPDAEVLGVDLHGVAAPVAPALAGRVVAPELGHHQGGHLLGVQRPGARELQLLFSALARARRSSGGALGFGLGIDVGR